MKQTESVLRAAKQCAANHQRQLLSFSLKKFGRISLVAASLFLAAFGANATNWYVRPSAAGANSGADWNNAWSLGSLGWSQVKGGDTIWMAGGTYGNSFAPGSSGTASAPIYVKRVQSTDAAPTAAAGWSSSFDSQVIVAPAAGSLPAVWTSPNVGSYLYIDGRVDSGISFRLNVNTGVGLYPACVNFNRGQSYVTLTNIDMAGPAPNSASYNFVYYQAGISAVAWNGSSYDNNVGLVVSHCRIHGIPDMVVSYGLNNVLFEYTKFYDNNASGSSGFHCNVFEYHAGANFTLRYCDISGWSVEGFRPYTSANNVVMYGNVWHDAIAGTSARVIEPDAAVPSGWGPIYFYNNTIANIPGNTFFAPTSQYPINYASGSITENNIFWNAGAGGAPGADYNYGNTSESGSHSVNGSGQSPFVNMAGGDYHIVTTVSANLPRNKGIALPAPYNVDMDGNVRGADGSWDIGAYEVGSGSTGTGTGGTGSSLVVNAITQNASDVDPNVTGTQVYQGTTVQYSGSATDTLPMTWKWIYTINGGTQNVFQTGSGTVLPISYTYGTNTIGNTYVWTLQVTDGTSTQQSQTTVAVEAQPVAQTGLSFAATSGVITSPLVSANGYISQSVETGVTNGGTATYTFTITNAGSYVIQGVVNAPNASANSFYVGIDSTPTDPYDIWQIPVTSGFESRIVSWQGTGTWDNPQFVPQVFTLNAGTHTLYIVGREMATQLQSISILKMVQPPQNLRVLANVVNAPTFPLVGQ